MVKQQHPSESQSRRTIPPLLSSVVVGGGGCVVVVVGTGAVVTGATISWTLLRSTRYFAATLRASPDAERFFRQWHS